MAEDREKISTGPNDRPVNESIGSTAPGFPDDALAPGEDALPEAPDDDAVEAARAALGLGSSEED